MFKNAHEESIDVIIFENKSRRIRCLALCPLLMIPSHLFAKTSCQRKAVTLRVTAFLIAQLLGEMGLLYLYIKWYKVFLFTGGKTEKELVESLGEKTVAIPEPELKQPDSPPMIRRPRVNTLTMAGILADESGSCSDSMSSIREELFFVNLGLVVLSRVVN